MLLLFLVPKQMVIYSSWSQEEILNFQSPHLKHLYFLYCKLYILGKHKSLRIIHTHLNVSKDQIHGHDWGSWVSKSSATTRFHLYIAFLYPLRILQTWVSTPNWISTLDAAEDSGESIDPLGLLKLFLYFSAF